MNDDQKNGKGEFQGTKKHMQRGLSAFRKGDHRRAIKHFRLIIRHDKEYVRAYNNLGYVYRSMGKDDEALKAWNAGLKIDPSYTRLRKNISGLRRSLELKKAGSGAIGIDDIMTDVKWLSGNAELTEIREGRFFDIYVIQDDDDRFAFKTPRRLLVHNPKLLKVFAQSCEPWLALRRCRYILNARSMEWIEGKPFTVMEYAAEESLQEFFTKPAARKLAGIIEDDWRHPSVTQILEFAVQLCIGIHFIHTELAVSHGDIRLENLFLFREAREDDDIKSPDPAWRLYIKISDIGLWPFFQMIGRLSDSGEKLPAELRNEGLVKTRSGYITPALSHCAPELMQTPVPPDIASDVFSFGVTLYEMLTGMLPFGGSSPSEKLQSMKEAPPEMPSAINDRIPQAICDVAMRCLAREHHERFEDFSKIAAALLDHMSAMNYALGQLDRLCRRYRKISNLQFYDEQRNESVMIVAGMKFSSEIAQQWEMLKRQAETDADSELMHQIHDIEEILLPPGLSVEDVYPTRKSIIGALSATSSETYREELSFLMNGDRRTELQ